MSGAAWNQHLSRAPTATPFHRHEALEVLADHGGATLYPLVVTAGDEPIGLFPVFEKSLGPVSAVFSPVPNLKIHNLGPVLVAADGLSALERERRSWQFVDTALSCLRERFAPQYVLVRTTVRYDDPRPFDWNGFEVTPRHSYVVDLTPDPETLLGRFSSDARRNVRNRSEGITVREAGEDAIDAVIERVRERHAEQGESYPLTPAFVRDCYDALPTGTVRPYVVEIDGEFVGGMVTLETDDTIYRWQGGVKTDTSRPVNDLLDWQIIRDAAERGLTRYDLMGANNPRISRYKAKFDPDLVTYQSMVKATTPMKLLATAYRRLR